MTEQQRRIQNMLDRLDELTFIEANIEAEFEYIDNAPYKTGHAPETQDWQPLQKHQLFGGIDKHYWIKSTFKTPKAPDHNKRLVINVLSGREGQWDAANVQGLVYLNGEMVQGTDVNHHEIALQYDTEYTMLYYLYTGTESAKPFSLDFNFAYIDGRLEKYYYDLLVPFQVCNMLDTADQNYIQMMTVLENSFDFLKTSDMTSEEFFDSLSAASQFLEDEFYTALCSRENKPIVNCIGHTHIDVEWLWTRHQTREKIQRSFATAAQLMKEYPEYKFMLSQPELYRYLKEEAPEKYAELKALIEQKRWEPEGAMYLEADCNLISGESMVRQILLGKKFFKDEFGADCKILFLPDVFGYSAAMPQILNKAGIRHFVTSKISWNDTNTMPNDTFMWQGIDGSEIFTNFITTQEYTNPPERNTTYVGMLTPSHVKGTWSRYSNKGYASRSFTSFGYGDGGGGPTKKMLETYRRLNRGIPTMPVTEMTFLLPHLDKVRKEFDQNCIKNKETPKWVGELYLEFHRGTYTSMAKNKRANRKSEFALGLCEALSYTDLLGGGNYDADGIKQNWLKVLHNQFHDIIPGSSIKEVYDLTALDYMQIDKFCNALIDEKLQKIADNVKAESGILVYNPSGFARRDTVCVGGKTYELKNEIAPFGFGIAELDDKCKVSVNGLTAENQYYRLTLNKNGSIKELYDKRAERQVFKNGKAGNEILVYEDLPHCYDNWEISSYYTDKVWSICDEAQITPIFDGSRAGFKVDIKYRNSTLTQKIWLNSSCERIDFETKADWHEHHQLLKASMPFNVLSSTATFEIQYGHVNRNTHKNTSWDKAKFEVYGHKWVDVSDNGFGVALLNDCKYGHSITGSDLQLTLLKCGTWPNPEADQGEHIFTYSLLPHTDNLLNARVINNAYELNQPLRAVEITSKGGNLPNSFSLAQIDKDNVIIENVKKAENDNSMIVRMYEAHNKKVTATVTVPNCFKTAHICNLLEENEQPLEIVNGSVTLPISNFQIITLKFEM